LAVEPPTFVTEAFSCFLLKNSIKRSGSEPTISALVAFAAEVLVDIKLLPFSSKLAVVRLIVEEEVRKTLAAIGIAFPIT